MARKTQSALVDEAPEFHPVKPPLVPQNHWELGGFRSLKPMIHWRFLEVASPVDHSGGSILIYTYPYCLKMGHVKKNAKINVPTFGPQNPTLFF